jgi:hypothetical protein
MITASGLDKIFRIFRSNGEHISLHDIIFLHIMSIPQRSGIWGFYSKEKTENFSLII